MGSALHQCFTHRMLFSLTKEAAESLVSVVPPLYFNHVRSLDVEVAEVLARKQHLPFQI